MSNENITREPMDVNDDSNERQRVHDRVMNKYEFARHRIEEAKHEIEQFNDHFRKSTEKCPVLKRDQLVTMRLMKLYAHCLDIYTQIMTQALQVFESDFLSSEGITISEFLQIAERTVDIISYVQKNAENRITEIQRQIEDMRNPETTEESK